MTEQSFVIPERVIAKINSALNVAIMVTLMKDPSFHQQMMEAANALDDAINDQPETTT